MCYPECLIIPLTTLWNKCCYYCCSCWRNTTTSASRSGIDLGDENGGEYVGGKMEVEKKKMKKKRSSKRQQQEQDGISDLAPNLDVELV